MRGCYWEVGRIVSSEFACVYEYRAKVSVVCRTCGLCMFDMSDDSCVCACWGNHGQDAGAEPWVGTQTGRYRGRQRKIKSTHMHEAAAATVTSIVIRGWGCTAGRGWDLRGRKRYLCYRSPRSRSLLASPLLRQQYVAQATFALVSWILFVVLASSFIVIPFASRQRRYMR